MINPSQLGFPATGTGLWAGLPSAQAAVVQPPTIPAATSGDRNLTRRRMPHPRFAEPTRLIRSADAPDSPTTRELVSRTRAGCLPLVPALTDYREVDRSIALARVSG